MCGPQLTIQLIMFNQSIQSMLYYSLKKKNIFIHSRNQGNVN